MGQQSSRQNCTCGCGAWDRRRFADSTDASQPPSAATSIHRYVSAVTERNASYGALADCSCRRRRWPPLQLRRPRPPCVCTAYRRAVDTGPDVASGNPGATEPPACRVAPINIVQRCNSCRDDQLAAVLALGARELRRELDALVGIAPSGEVEGVENAPAEAAGAAELLLWSVANLDPEDMEERARARRALEIAQGVEAPPGFRPHFQVVCNGELRALLLRAPPAPAPTVAPLARVHTQVDYIHCLVPDLKEITACCFYWGKMDRYEAERLLDNKPEGTFLLRDSAQEEHLFSVSFRKYGRSLHARIEHFNHKFSFDSHDPAVFSADTVTALIHHYKDPACVMFFEPMLTAPLPRTSPFSLQQLARAVIVSSTTYDGVETLPLPARLRAYLKEYHYKQRVRVRRLDSLACLHTPAETT